MTRYDVVVIGGSLAGASCALGLERAGVDVVTFDRDRFPREKVCGEFLSPGALDCLRELGVLEDVVQAGAVLIDRGRIHSDGGDLDIPFPRPGMGFSRSKLDSILARKAGVRHGCQVLKVVPGRDGFVVQVHSTDGATEDVVCDVVIDAAGKLSRFTQRQSTGQFGVQYHEERDNGSVLDFEFFDGGYGGSVSVESGRTNSCFLVDRAHLDPFLEKDGCIVTGPVAYRRVGGEYLAIGDAAGMIDPFCGEGMRHAMDSGILAARVVSSGHRNGMRYEDMCRAYESAWRSTWARKRTVASGFRSILDRPWLGRKVFSLGGRFPKLASVVVREFWR